MVEQSTHNPKFEDSYPSASAHGQKEIAKSLKVSNNWDPSATSFCRQVAAQVQNMFCNSCVLNYHKNANNLVTAVTREKLRPYLESLEF